MIKNGGLALRRGSLVAASPLRKRHKGAGPRSLIRGETRRFIIYIRRTSLGGLAYTVRAVARHLNCRRVQRAVINRAGDRN